MCLDCDIIAEVDVRLFFFQKGTEAQRGGSTLHIQGVKDKRIKTLI